MTKITTKWKLFLRDSDGLHHVRRSLTGGLLVRIAKVTLDRVNKSHGCPPTPQQIEQIRQAGFDVSTTTTTGKDSTCVLK